jgi:hypothetical protein
MGIRAAPPPHAASSKKTRQPTMWAAVFLVDTVDTMDLVDLVDDFQR